MSAPSTILAPMAPSSSNKIDPHHGLATPLKPATTPPNPNHQPPLGSKSVADTNKMLSLPLAAGLWKMAAAVISGQPSSSSSSSSVAAHDEKQQQLLKASLTADLKLLMHEFERFQQHGDNSQGKEEATERATKVEFFLGYIERVLKDIEMADAPKLAELEVQIKTSLLPLKGKVISQLHGRPSSASLASTATTPPASPVPSGDFCLAETLMPRVGGVRRDDSSLGTTSSEASEEESGGHLDDLDLECFSLIIEDAAHAGAAAGGAPMARHGSFYDDDMTDAGSLASEGSSRSGVAPVASRKRVLEGEPACVVVEQAKRPCPVPPGSSSSSNLVDASKQPPREVEYQCGACSDTYSAASSLNPWWALEQQECPKCKKVQIPRIDITLPANTMDYHPALLAEEGDDDDEDEVGVGGAVDEFRGEDEEAMCVPEEDDEAALTLAQASQLLGLLSHARACPGHHKTERAKSLCTSVKYVMLHVRDCDGKTLDGEACSFSWCRPCKHLLGHLVRCYDAEKCGICSSHGAAAVAAAGSSSSTSSLS